MVTLDISLKRGIVTQSELCRSVADPKYVYRYTNVGWFGTRCTAAATKIKDGKRRIWKPYRAQPIIMLALEDPCLSHSVVSMKYANAQLCKPSLKVPHHIDQDPHRDDNAMQITKES